MLTQQFFTRVQLTKILNFKNDGSIRDLEKKGFLIPQIKPSKYTFNQVLFMMICKEITDVTHLSWKHFIDANFNTVLKKNLIDYNLLFLYEFKNANQPHIDLINNDPIAEDLNNYLNGDLFYSVSKFQGIENANEYTPSYQSYSYKDYNLLMFSIDCVNRKLHKKCIELKIDLNEKYSISSQLDKGSNKSEMLG